MAVYKVAQDVEADDKLLGPFSFRQFIYLIIVAIAIALAWGLSRIFIGLAIIPLPIILFFGALALPLRKDQPMEIYLAAIVSYHLKPRKRLWTPDGLNSLVEITAPKIVEVQRTKDISQTEAEKRLSYLANLADTEGWAIRHTANPFENASMVSDVYGEAQQAEDVLDENGGVSQSFGTMISQSDQQRKQQMIARMQQSSQQPLATLPTPPVADPYASLSTPASMSTHEPTTPAVQPQFNPYPTSIHQSVIQPLGTIPSTPPAPTHQTAAPVAATEPQNTSPSTSKTTISPDIINLASNPDLSIDTIQREANRIKQKEQRADDDEVFISLH